MEYLTHQRLNQDHHSLLDAKELQDLYENHEHQWKIRLHDKWGVETTDGIIVKMAACNISFGRDQETPNQQGQCSLTVGETP